MHTHYTRMLPLTAACALAVTRTRRTDREGLTRRLAHKHANKWALETHIIMHTLTHPRSLSCTHKLSLCECLFYLILLIICTHSNTNVLRHTNHKLNCHSCYAWSEIVVALTQWDFLFYLSEQKGPFVCKSLVWVPSLICMQKWFAKWKCTWSRQSKRDSDF